MLIAAIPSMIRRSLPSSDSFELAFPSERSTITRAMNPIARAIVADCTVPPGTLAVTYTTNRMLTRLSDHLM